MKALALETEQELTFQTRGVEVLKRHLKEHGRVTADDVHDEIGEPSSYSEWGSLFRHKEFRKLARAGGFDYSKRTGGIIHVWVLREDVEEEEKVA